MALKAAASSPISSPRLAYSVMRVSTSPWANLWAKAHTPFRGSTIFCTVMEQMTREMSSTATAVTKKSWNVLCKKSSTAVVSAATNSSPVGRPEETSSPVSGSGTRGERSCPVT